MSKEESQRVRHFYLRDFSTANKHPVGCIAVELKRETNEIHYAFSVCSPLDKFNADLAKTIAVGRLKKKPTILQGKVPNTGHEITKCIMEHIISTHTKQGGTSRSFLACSAANGWLTTARNKITN